MRFSLKQLWWERDGETKVPILEMCKQVREVKWHFRGHTVNGAACVQIALSDQKCISCFTQQGEMALEVMCTRTWTFLTWCQWGWGGSWHNQGDFHTVWSPHRVYNKDCGTSGEKASGLPCCFCLFVFPFKIIFYEAAIKTLIRQCWFSLMLILQELNQSSVTNDLSPEGEEGWLTN